MTTPLIFLDIDGVLNGHEKWPNGYYGIREDCAQQFNRIIAVCNPDIVVSSAWRYMMLRGSMSTEGFLNMLLTHGVSYCNIIGLTEPDSDLSAHNRGWLIRKKLDELTKDGPRPYVVIDNLDLGIRRQKLNFVQTDDYQGLTEEKADEVIKLLKEQEHAIAATERLPSPA